MEPKTPDEINKMKSILYQSAVGSLMYMMIGTRPDIAFAVGAVSRYMANPGKAHWTAVKRIFCYLKATQDIMLKYKGTDELCLIGYCDTDWAGDVDNC